MLSVRAKKVQHSGAMEAQAVLLALRRLLRNGTLHGHRGFFLVDARVVRAALTKGRSSAPTLRRVIGQIGALLLACDMKLFFGHIPSECTPADKPSRGVRPAKRACKVRQPRVCKFDLWVENTAHLMNRFLGRPPLSGSSMYMPSRSTRGSSSR